MKLRSVSTASLFGAWLCLFAGLVASPLPLPLPIPLPIPLHPFTYWSFCHLSSSLWVVARLVRGGGGDHHLDHVDGDDHDREGEEDGVGISDEEYVKEEVEDMWDIDNKNVEE